MMGRAALLLIGVQREYFAGGRLPLSGVDEALGQVLRLLDWGRSQGLLVAHILMASQRVGAPYFAPGSPGIQLHPALSVLPGELLLEKRLPSAFAGTGLDGLLRDRQVERFIIAGFPTHLCCDATVRDGYHRGYRVLVAGDACATRDLRQPGGGAVIAPMVQAATLASLADGMARVAAVDQIISGEVVP